MLVQELRRRRLGQSSPKRCQSEAKPIGQIWSMAQRRGLQMASALGSFE